MAVSKGPTAWLKRELRVFSKARRGGIIALTALILPVIIGISALSVDVGLLYLAKSRAEMAATLAAEAGIERLPDQQAAARLAQRVGTSLLDGTRRANSYNVDVSTSATRVTVEVRIIVGAIFGRLVGSNEVVAFTSVARSI